MEVEGGNDNVDIGVVGDEGGDDNVDMGVLGDEGGDEIYTPQVGDQGEDEIYTPQVADDKKPRKSQEFETLDDVFNFYNAYAKEAGFSVRSWSLRKKGDEIIRKEYVCFKQGKSCRIADSERKRRRGTIKEGCNAKLAVVKSKSGMYVVTVFVEGHSHSLSTPRRTYLLRSHRNFLSAQKDLTQQLAMANIPQYQQFNFLGVQAGGIENVGCTRKDFYNSGRDRRQELAGHDGNMLFEFLKLEQEKNPAFTFKIEKDDQDRITRCFWSDATSRRAYNSFGDVVVFDTTYNTNRYAMIFAPLVGVNNHGQTTFFAGALLNDETTDSFLWLFSQFLQAMPGDAPRMIITDQDLAMTKAISEALPRTFHRYCSWHILMKFSEKLDSIKYTAHYKDFSDCIWKSEGKAEFDVKWMELVEKSGLNDNKWLHDMYEIRAKWVPAHVNHVFSAGMSSSQRAESCHAFFKRYVNKSNSLSDFMIQFGLGLARQRQEELMADNKDLVEKPKLKMPHYFLEQMGDTYTLEMFYEFQEQFWESWNYRFELVKDGELHQLYNISRKNVEKCKVRQLTCDKDSGLTTCSCKKFESSGIPCRHILAYLTMMHHLEKIPDYYILKRWTKSDRAAPVVVGNGTQIKDDSSRLLRRSQLIKFSLDAIDKALESEETIKVYTDSVDQAVEKINAMIGCGTTVGIGTSTKFSQSICVGKSARRSQSVEQSYHEPIQVRAKGCGSRLKGGKEKALRRAKKYKGRKCNGCGEVGVSHDKRNCPNLKDRSIAADEDSSPDDATQDLDGLTYFD